MPEYTSPVLDLHVLTVPCRVPHSRIGHRLEQIGGKHQVPLSLFFVIFFLSVFRWDDNWITQLGAYGFLILRNRKEARQRPQLASLQSTTSAS
jgi:hypothetical protein